MSIGQKISMILIVLGIGAHISQAQKVYPVQNTVVVKPPYSLCLKDYASATSDKLSVNLLLQDFNRTNYPVYLQLSIRGVGIHIYSRPKSEVNYVPVYLNGGVLQQVSGLELEPYLRPEHLIFEGISKSEFIRSGQKLPEGIYQISVQVFDYNMGVHVSNVHTQIAYLILNDPPRFTAPQLNQVVKATDPQNVLFQWTPMHRNSPNSAFSTEYEFTLVEIFPENRNPNDAILTSQPIYQATVSTNMLHYNVNMPALIPGRKYVARLKAMAPNNLDLFKNSGYSEVMPFVFGKECKKPLNVAGKGLTPYLGEIRWDGDADHTKFTLKYKEYGNHSAQWFEKELYTQQATITQLKPGQRYAYRLTGHCGSLKSRNDAQGSFTTLDNDYLDSIDCGNADITRKVTNQNGLVEAKVGDYFKIGLFKMLVKEVSGTSGMFSGKGEVKVPFLNTNIKVGFHNIKVNERYEVFEGEVKALSTGLSLMSIRELQQIIREEGATKTAICNYEPENTLTSELNFNEGDLLYEFSAFNVYKGDTIILNDEEVIVDENTTFKDSDKIKKDDKILVIGNEIADNQSDSLSAPQDAGMSNISLPDKIEKKLSKRIEDALKNICDKDEETIIQLKKAHSEISIRINELISDQKLFKDVIAGKNNEYLNESLSDRLHIEAEQQNTNSSDEVNEIYHLHWQLYEKDVAKQNLGDKKKIISSLFDGKRLIEGEGYNQLSIHVKKKLSEIDSVVLEELEKSKKDLIERLENICDAYFDNLISGNLNVHNGYGSLLLASNSNNQLGKYFVSTKLASADSLPISPSVKAKALDEIITRNNRVIGHLDPKLPIDLPIGLNNRIGGVDFLIGIEKMVFTPRGAWLNAYMSLPVPFANDNIPLSLSHIKLSPIGFTRETDLKLFLSKDKSIRLNNNVLLTLKADEHKTFVAFDCNGFRSLQMDGYFEFCEKLIVPEDEAGNIIEGERVKAKFNINIANWNEFIVKVDIDRFQLAKQRGFSFFIQDAVVDFSDVSNPAGILFPADYQHGAFSVENLNLWRGFYLQKLEMKMPREFKRKTSPQKRVSILLENMILDYQGFSGNIRANQIISLHEGIAADWGFSLDSLLITIVANQVKEARMRGMIQIPILDQPLEYQALILEDGYLISTKFNKELKIPMFAADVILYEGSEITLEKNVDGFKPAAKLNGSLSIRAGEKAINEHLSISAIDFQGLNINERSEVSLDAIALGNGNQNSFSKFPISISDIKAKNEAGKIGLEINLKLNLVKAKDEGFSALGNLTLWGKKIQDTDTTGWKFDRLEVDELAVNFTKSKHLSFKGSIAFFERDTLYGNGFQGILDAKLGGIGLKASALFGKTREFRYWYADAYLISESGIPLYTFNIHGFGGGAYYHMKQAPHPKTRLNSTGSNHSGIHYVPDINTHLGFKASVTLAVEKPEALNGDALFEISFNNSGGLRRASLSGNVYFLTSDFSTGRKEVNNGLNAITQKVSKKNDLAIEKPKGQVCGKMELYFDNDNDVFHGDIAVFVNIGNGLIKGIGSNNLAGKAVIHFSPDKWYVHLGNPDNPIGLNILGLAKTRSYFMAGHDLPGSPPPPEGVSSILGNDMDYMRELNSLGTGKGFAFGSELQLSTGDIEFLMFYANINAGTGFDIMMKDYGNASCQGRGGSLGINGWYANGQAYAYMQGKIGINVNLLFYKGRYDIIDVGAAALLQAQGPNPVWMKGTVGGYFNILNGLVKGTCQFEVEIGEKCKIDKSSELEGVRIIAELTPSDGAKEVDVFNSPQAIFNMPIDRSFSISDQGKINSYRFKLTEFAVRHKDSTIPAEIVWNDTKDVAALNSEDIFPSNTELSIQATVNFEKLLGSSWELLKDKKGKTLFEEKSLTFSTGKAPDYLPDKNVAFSYPQRMQYNFHPEEYKSGFVTLKKGMPELFNPDNNWLQKGRITDNNSQIHYFDFSYANKNIRFNVPQNLASGKIHRLEIVNIPANKLLEIDENVKEVVEKKELGGSTSSTMDITTKDAEGTIENYEEKVIYETHFRTSEFNKMSDKIDNLEVFSQWRNPIRINVHELVKSFYSTEYFEGAEIHSELVQMEAVINEDRFFTERVYPYLYQNYPIDGNITIKHRDTDELGIIPTKAVFIRQYPDNGVLTIKGLQQPANTLTDGPAAFVYGLSHYYEKDLIDIQTQLANKYIKGNYSEDARRILNYRLPVIYGGDYKIKLNYILPGSNKIISEKIISINNPIAL